MTTLTAEYRRFVARLALGGLASILANVRNVALLPFLTRGLGIEGYGAWAQALGTVELLSAIAILSLNSALSRFTGAQVDAHSAAQGLWSSMLACLVVGCCLAVVTWAGADWVAATFLQGGHFAGVIQVAAVLIPVTACEKLLVAFFHARLQVWRHTMGLVCETLVYAGLAIFLVRRGATAGAILGALVAARLLVLVGGTAVVLAGDGLARPSRRVLGEYLRFSAPLMLVALFSWVTGLSDRYVVGLFCGAAAVGAYSVSYTLGMLCALLFAPVFMVLTPTLVPLWESGQRGALFGHLRHVLRYSMAVVIPAIVGLTVLAEPIVRAVADETYFIGRATVAFVASGIFLLMLSGIMEPLVYLLRRTGTSAVVYGAAAVVNLGVDLALVPSLGPLGAAIGTCVAYGAQFGGFYFYLRQKGLSVTADHVLLAKVAVAAAVMAWVVGRLDVVGVDGLIVAVLVGISTYALTLLILRAFPRREWLFWRDLLRPRPRT